MNALLKANKEGLTFLHLAAIENESEYLDKLMNLIKNIKETIGIGEIKRGLNRLEVHPIISLLKREEEQKEDKTYQIKRFLEITSKKWLNKKRVLKIGDKKKETTLLEFFIYSKRANIVWPILEKSIPLEVDRAVVAAFKVEREDWLQEAIFQNAKYIKNREDKNAKVETKDIKNIVRVVLGKIKSDKEEFELSDENISEIERILNSDNWIKELEV